MTTGFLAYYQGLSTALRFRGWQNDHHVQAHSTANIVARVRRRCSAALARCDDARAGGPGGPEGSRAADLWVCAEWDDDERLDAERSGEGLRVHPDPQTARAFPRRSPRADRPAPSERR